MFLGGTSAVTATTGGTAGTWDETNLTLTWEPDANTDYTYFAFYQDGKAASGSNFLAEEDAIVVTYEGGSEPPVQPTYETVTIPYTEALISSQGKFVIEDVELGGLSAVWTTSQYGMTANGYQCTDDIESWLVSPLIDATSVSAVNLNFDESLNYFTNDVAEEASLWVREGEDGEWVNVTIPTHTLDANNQWHNVGDIDLSAYAGKVFQLGFKYTAIVGSPGRWEIKNMEVTEGVVENAKVTTVGEFNALETGADFDFTGTGLVATAQKGSYLYAQDATGGMLIYGNVGQTYAKGAVIPAGFTATKAEFHGAPQAGSPTGFTASSTTADVTAKEMAAADFAATTFADYQANFGLYAVVRGVTVEGNTMTLADGTTTVATYTTFATVPESTSGKTYDVYGIMGWRDGVQFLPTEYVEMGSTTHAAPTITVNPEKEVYFVGDEVSVKFTSEETGVNIGYDITDAETFPENYCVPVSNGDSITVTLNEPGVVNVRAFAYGYNEGDVLGNSEVVTKTLTFVAKPELGDQYELVTSADQIAADKEYVLAYSDETVTVAMGAAATYGSNNVRVSVEAGSSEFTLEDGVITLMSTTTVTPFTLETSETEGFYNIKIDDDQYIYWTSGNTAATGTTLGDVTVALDSVGNALIKYNVTEDRYLQYNASSPRFCFYKGTQKYPQLYVKVAATPDVKLGDVNGDGDVNVNDVTVLINYILGKNPTPFVEANANVNGDEGINVNDVTALINMILN
ncbi:MAG: dockerin type I repeat-containing protein [Muribaculaceae bacterium]|nr:dockerin type I repeat-containing protein [Muribaculaceae bacterium]